MQQNKKRNMITKKDNGLDTYIGSAGKVVTKTEGEGNGNDNVESADTDVSGTEQSLDFNDAEKAEREKAENKDDIENEEMQQKKLI